MLNNNPLEEGWCHTAVPHAFRINDDDWPARADPKTRRLAAFHATRAEEKILSLEERCELRVQLAPPPIGGAEAPDADEHVARIRFQKRL